MEKVMADSSPDCDDIAIINGVRQSYLVSISATRPCG